MEGRREAKAFSMGSGLKMPLAIASFNDAI